MKDKKPKIKFSHIYDKMPQSFFDPQPPTTILAFVSKVQFKDLPQRFIDYDTMYDDENGNFQHYKLPKTELIILGLLTGYNELWTTIRRYTPDKMGYYASSVGKEVEIVIKEVLKHEK